MEFTLPWHPEAAALYHQLLERPPEAFRLSASRALLRDAERRASARGALRVEVVDVVQACVLVTPDPFRARMFDFLGRRGFAVEPAQRE